jgi:hypothetical protein
MKTIKGKLIKGKELRYAAVHGVPVYYVEKYLNPMDTHMNYDGKSMLTKAPYGYYIGNSDIDPDAYGDDEVVSGEFDEGNFFVFKLNGVKYS